MTGDYLVTWLAGEDDSALGECHGSTLNGLLAAGLAEIVGSPQNLHSRVRLTDAGWQRALELRNPTGGTPAREESTDVEP